MARTKRVNGEPVPLTRAEETAADKREATHNARQSKEAATQYKLQRRLAYPSLEEQVAAIFEQFKADKARGKTLTAEADAILTSINAVKGKYPKP